MVTEPICPRLLADVPDPEQGRIGDIDLVEADGLGRTVARVHRGFLSESQVIARARLLAAAPDLLAALECAVQLLERVRTWEGDGQPIGRLAAQKHGDEFRAAIARALTSTGASAREE